MEQSNSPNSPEDQSTRSRSQLADRVKQDSRERIERGKQVAADQVEQLADALDQAGSRLNDGQPTIASYASRLADGLDDLFAQQAHRCRTEDHHPLLVQADGALVGMEIDKLREMQAWCGHQ